MSDKVRILYIDDYDLDRELVKDVLEKEHGGFELTEASNKKEFEKLLKTHAFDLVLTDFNIAGFEGLQVMETVRAHDPRIPVIIVTGTGSEEIAVTALKQGASDYVIKRSRHIQKLPQTIFAAIKNTALRDQHQKAEAALIESEERFRNIAESSLVGIYIVQDGIFIYVNPKFAEIFGYSVKECLSNMHFRQLVYPDDFDMVQEQIRKRISGEYNSVRYAFRGVKKDGKIIHVEIFGSSILLSGKPADTGTMIDITERMQFEEALRDSETRMRTLVRAIPDLVWLKDPNGIYLSCNSRIERLFGAKEKDIIGKTDYDFTDRKSADSFRDQDKIAMAKGIPIVYEEEVAFTDDGHREILETIKTPMYRSDGQLAGVLGIGRNITERVNLQTQLLQAQKMESVGRLAGGVAHDYNNALSVIIGFTELAMEKTDPAGPLHADLNEVLNAAKHATDITRQLLAFARKQTIAPKVLDLNDTIESMLIMFRRLIGENIDLAWMPGAEVWPVKIDPGQVNQILANLCVNARDAIADVGKVTIETGNAIFDEDYCADQAGFIPGEYVLLAVSDDGSGMPPETLDKLFEPFFTTKDVNKGTGLGLATVYGIVKQNSGFINVYSEPEKGTTFRIYFPRHETDAEQIRKKAPVMPDARGSETILLVEDEPSILKMTTIMLELLGYTVLGASTPGEAIRLAREHSGEIHLLMTDVVMPEMNGRDLARNLLTLYPSLKRLFMSGYTANVIAHHGVLDEGVNFIQKPFARKDLASKVRESLSEIK